MRISKLSSAVADRLRALAFRFRASGPGEVASQMKDTAPLHQEGQWIPLAAASQILYDELDGTMWRAMADRETTPEARLNYMASCLVRDVPIEGRTPPSSRYRNIPPVAFDAGIIKGGGKYFQRYYESYLTFLDMRVRGEDLREALQRMKITQP